MLRPSTRRVLMCAFAAGALLAVVSGVSVSDSASTNSGGAPVASDVELGFAPEFALIGFLTGAPISATVGFLWGRSGAGGLLGALLVTILGGLAGLVAAALLGARTVVTSTGTSASMEHGAPPTVLIGGAILGAFIGAECAWRSRARLENTPAQ